MLDQIEEDEWDIRKIGLTFGRAHLRHQRFARFFRITLKAISPQEPHLHPEKSSTSSLYNVP